MLVLDPGRRAAFARLVTPWLTRRGVRTRDVEVVEVEVLLSGRPALYDVVARAGGRLAHLVVGLHEEGATLQMLRHDEESVLGRFEDEHGPAIAVDALWDADLAPLVMVAIVGQEPSVVSIARDDDAGVVLDVDDRAGLTVFPWLSDRGHPGVEMLVSLDEAGFNHLAAPIAIWRRQGRDLGIVQELLAESADGWALALTSLRDLYGSAGPPEEAGGDFADEALALGTMTARMHLASAQAFGRRIGAVADWAAEVELVVRRSSPGLLSPGAGDALASVRSSADRSPMVRTHGDLHLGRVARTNAGWVVADWLPGGVDAEGNVLFRSPLADVADMLWSLHYVASSALEERDPAVRRGLEPVATAWEERNHRAFVVGYLGTQGIEQLVPSDRRLVDELTGVFELEQSARRPAGVPLA
jgi:predicted trehalose synthase